MAFHLFDIFGLFDSIDTETMPDLIGNPCGLISCRNGKTLKGYFEPDP